LFPYRAKPCNREISPILPEIEIISIIFGLLKTEDGR
jgi:hypothetical protein